MTKLSDKIQELIQCLSLNAVEPDIVSWYTITPVYNWNSVIIDCGLWIVRGRMEMSFRIMIELISKGRACVATAIASDGIFIKKCVNILA